MDNSTFWTSRSELINWINVTLNVKLTKIEEVRATSPQTHALAFGRVFWRRARRSALPART